MSLDIFSMENTRLAGTGRGEEKKDKKKKKEKKLLQ